MGVTMWCAIIRVLSERVFEKMPTVVLLDTSLSMRRPASKSNCISRHELASSGIEWFLEYLEKCFPLEYTSFHTFSSSSEALHPFTRDYSKLKEKMTEITFHDRTNLHSALVAVSEYVVAEWGSFAPCQLVIVTDASPGVKHQDDLQGKQTISTPFSCQSSIVCVAAQEELMRVPSPGAKSNVERLCSTAGVTQAQIFIPSGALTVDSLKGAFKQMVKTHFQPFATILKCGHLQSRVSLVPSPSMYRSKNDLVIGPDYKFPSLDNSLMNLEFPQEMLVCGFLDNCSIPAPPHYSRHFVLDPEMDRKTLDLELKSPTMSSGMSSSSSSDNSKGFSPEDTQKPSFRVLLHGSLKCESKTALLKLG